jgi:hypothetical protein
MAGTEVQVTIGSILFSDSASLSAGVGYFLADTPTLLKSPDPRSTQSDRQGLHGINDSLSFYKERILAFKGTIVGSSQADRKTKQTALEKALALPALPNFATNDGYQLILITDEDGTLKQCYAKMIAAFTPDIVDNADPSLRDFTFVMIAKDPALYGQSLQTASGPETVAGTNFQVVQSSAPKIPFQIYSNTVLSCTATNNGTIGSAPAITVNGPTSAPKITNVTTGKTMSFPSLTLLAGEKLVITVSGPTIYKYDVSNNKTDASGFLDVANSQWIYLEPGANVLDLLDSSPDVIAATLQVQWRDAYI